MATTPQGVTGWKSPRALAVAEQLRDLAEGEDWVSATAMLLVDAILDEEVEPLQAFLRTASLHADRKKHERELQALASVAQWGISRILPKALVRDIDWTSAEGRVLIHTWMNPDVTSTDLFKTLGLAEETVSRIGNQLERDGLVIRARAGKWVLWRLSQQGEQVVSSLAPIQEAQEKPQRSTPRGLALARSYIENRRTSTARALTTEGLTLGEQGRFDDAISLFDKVFEDFAKAKEPPLQTEVVRALFAKTLSLHHLGRLHEAVSCFQKLAERIDETGGPALLQEAAFVGKGLLLNELGEQQQSLHAFKEWLSSLRQEQVGTKSRSATSKDSESRS